MTADELGHAAAERAWVAARGAEPRATLRPAEPAPPGLRIGADPPYDDVMSADGGWMDDLVLARRLVTPDDHVVLGEGPESPGRA